MSDVNFVIVPFGMPHQAFLEATAAEFPIIAAELLDEEDIGLIHLQVAALTRYANGCLTEGNLTEFERILRFVEHQLPNADSHLDNALYVSFLEDLALDGDSAVIQAARQLLLPEHLSFYSEVRKWHRDNAGWSPNKGAGSTQE